ncbi:MAG: hypothetical protein JWQ09_1894 [Segetibacter sp.]|nr:hypothetical protein [Segetibacter sp.]
MPHHQPFQITGFHSCDREVGLKVLNGSIDLKPSNNAWDWLGSGIYFWEQNPKRALEYAVESSKRIQFNKIRIKTPFVLGAIIELGHCLNLIEPESLSILKEAFYGLEAYCKEAGEKMPINDDNNRRLDCAVIRYVHQSRVLKNLPPYDTIRCAFPEGEPVYPGTTLTSRGHIQVCVLNDKLIRAYFLPRPVAVYNPYLVLPE